MNTFVFENGIRVVHQQTSSPVAYCGLAMNVGTRDESLTESGMAHFVEHMLFKGTKRRRAHHVLNRMEVVGGELNAYTTKEETFVYSVSLSEYIERALDLIADVVFSSTFPQHEIEKEISVVLDEIQSYKDSPYELIFDEFEEQFFSKSSLGRSILGEPKLLKKYTSQDLFRFVNNNYHTDQMVLFCLGNISWDRFLRLAERYFAIQQEKKRTFVRQKAEINSSSHIEKKRHTHQAHFLLGAEAPSMLDNDRMSFYLLNNILGGPGMNSMLNLALRERSGLAYNVESNYTLYSDSAVASIYVGTDLEHLEKCKKIILQTIDKLQQNLFSPTILNRYKQQILGQMAIAAENKENVILNAAKSFLHFHSLQKPEETKSQILEITPLELQDLSQKVFAGEKISSLLYK